MTIEQRELFEALHASRLDAIKVFNRREFRGVWNSIIDKYPEAAHFVYELLQNADDAGFGSGRVWQNPRLHPARKHNASCQAGKKGRNFSRA